MRSTCPRDNISDDNTGSDKGLFDEDAADTSSAMNTVE
jgi:hypothetical protein